MTKKSLIDELLEDKEQDEKIIKSFYSKPTLSSDVFIKSNGKYKMVDSIRKTLLSISDEFIDFIGVDFFIHDIILTGSLANYNWSEYSDIDLHIIIDYQESGHNIELLKEFFNTKKNEWNSSNNIKIKGFDVELYVQDITEPHISSGVYSVLNNKWIIEPQKEKYKIDEKLILEKGEEYATQIDELIEKNKDNIDIRSEIDNLRKKLKKFRQSGLEKGGEYSYENLTFKLLRRNGYIGKLIDLKKEINVKKLSLNESHDFNYKDILNFEKKSIEFYGFTEDFHKAGFITPSGYLLDFSQGSGSRAQDHRNITYIFHISNFNFKKYGIDESEINTIKGLELIMRMGFIRFLPEKNGLEIWTMPTQEQFGIIRNLIREKNGKIIIELNRDVYKEYGPGTIEETIINGIKNYYKYGERPSEYSDDDDFI